MSLKLERDVVPKGLQNKKGFSKTKNSRKRPSHMITIVEENTTTSSPCFYVEERDANSDVWRKQRRITDSRIDSVSEESISECHVIDPIDDKRSDYQSGGPKNSSFLTSSTEFVQEHLGNRPHLITPQTSSVDLPICDDNSKRASVEWEPPCLMDHGKDSKVLKNVLAEKQTDIIEQQESIASFKCRIPTEKQSDATEQQETLASSKKLCFTVTLLRRFALPIVLVLVALSYSIHGICSSPSFVDEASVYVPGGGFSGFWFTLGRLESIPDPENRNYYCYSAGCLGVVAMFSNYTMEETYSMAFGVQQRWKSGQIDRYQVVHAFLDDLIYGRNTSSAGNDTVTSASGRPSAPLSQSLSLLSKLNIITSVGSKWLGLKPHVRTPSSLQELHKMLLQTTWIPFATGNDLFHESHMDGAFTATQHPKCVHNVGLVLNLDLFANIVNVNLGRDKVEKLWNVGLAHGV